MSKSPHLKRRGDSIWNSDDITTDDRPFLSDTISNDIDDACASPQKRRNRVAPGPESQVVNAAATSISDDGVHSECLVKAVAAALNEWKWGGGFAV